MDKYIICDESKHYKRPKLTTSDITVTALMGEEMRRLIEHETDPSKKLLFSNLLEVASNDPDNGLWSTIWDVSFRKGEQDSFAYIYFEGMPERGAVTLSFYTSAQYSWDSKVADALRLVTDWAFSRYPGLYTIDTYIDAESDGFIRNAERADFVYRSTDEGIEHYSIEKQPTAWTGLYLFIGIIAGMIFGFLFSSMAAGMACGVIIGLLFGAALDNRFDAKRSEITGQSKKGTFYAKRHKTSSGQAEDESEDSLDSTESIFKD